MVFRFICLDVTLTNDKDQSQGLAHYDCEYLMCGQIGQTLPLPSNMNLHVGLPLEYLDLTVAYSNDLTINLTVGTVWRRLFWPSCQYLILRCIWMDAHL